MVSLRDLVRARLKALGIRQQDFAARLNVDPRVVSAVLQGDRPPPVEDVAAWARALDIGADEQADLLDAMHVAAASEYVRAMIERLDERATTAERTLARYRDRHGYVRYILDHVEPVPGGGAPPPTPSAEEMIAIAAEIIAVRNAMVHGLPMQRITEPTTPPAPSGN